MTTTTAPYILVPAPGCYSDRTRVISVHTDLDEAKRACRSQRVCVRTGHEGVADADGEPMVPPSAAGDAWLAVYEQGNPILYRRPAK